MRVFVTTCDKYYHILPIFAHQFNKHWSPDQEVVIVGFSNPTCPLPPNFSFISLGNMEDYPFNKWSDALLKLISILNNDNSDDVFCLLLEDYIMTRKVNVDAIQILYDYMVQFRYVVKVDLCEDRLYAHGADLSYGYVSYLDLVKSMPGSPYHMSLWPGLWNKKHLFDTLRPDWTAHQVELNGTPELSHRQDLIVLGTRQAPLRITNIVRGSPGELDLSGLTPEDVEELRGRNLVEI